MNKIKRYVLRLSKDMRSRTWSLFIFLMIALLLVDFFRFSWLQLVKDDEYRQAAQNSQLSDTIIAPMRGTIYDANMNALAQSATVWNVYLNTKKLNQAKPEIKKNFLNDLADILEYDDEKRAELKEIAEENSSYVVIEKKVELETKTKLTKMISENKKEKYAEFVGLTPSTKRYYQDNSLATSVLGFTGTDDQGITGLELYYDSVLTGTPGRIITAKDALRNKLPDGYETTIDAKNGNSIILTMDQSIQSYLEKNLEDTVNDYDAKGGYGIVMDVNTGAVLAMSSQPDFDLSQPWTIVDEKKLQEIDAIANDEDKKKARSDALNMQWKNRVISDVYVPGSVFKIFVAAAALEEKVESVNDTYTCTGSIRVEDRVMNCHLRTGHGHETFVQGLENSCNPFFITVGQKLGSSAFCKYFEAFGFTEKTNIDLPGEGNSIYVKEKDMTKVSLASASFGQTNSLTPIQVCTALCSIANGGKLMQPYMVSEVIDDDGNTVSKTKPVVKRQVISEETSKTVCSMMESVVLNGTGKNGYVAGYHVGGKTGTSTKLGETAEGEKKKYLASFAAIAPADDPQIAVLIVIDEPNQDLGGGALAAPIAAGIIEQTLKKMNVEPRYTEKELANVQAAAPNVIGSTVEKATNKLKDEGFECKVVGNGQSIVKQSPAAGAVIPKGGTVVVYTESGAQEETIEMPDFKDMSVTQANVTAASLGLNITINGNNLTSGDVIAYKQSVEPGAKVKKGSVVTVYFKHTTGISDIG